MDDARRPWRQALELAVRLGILAPDQGGLLAQTLGGASEAEAASLTLSAGVPANVMDSLLSLAKALAARPDLPSQETLVTPRGMETLASDLVVHLDDPAPADAVPGPEPVKLTLTIPGPASQKWQFAGPASVLIGRSPRAHVRIEDTHVSGVHAVIEITGLGCRLRDVQSANHTFVNGKRIDLHELVDGDEVRVGRTTLRVLLRSTPPSTTQRPAPSLDPVIPGYTIETLLGKGAQGQVFLAHELANEGRLVALKTMTLPYILDDRECGRRVKYFLREAMIAPAFRHPRVVEFYRAGVAGRSLYVVMEYLAGGDLGSLLRKTGPLSCAQACRFVLQALDAMSAAHSRNLVHRDLKPENFILTQASVEADLKVGDLGLAKNFILAGLSGFTESSVCGGTIEYMAPEQLTDFKYVGPPADVFSLGAVLFRLLTGRGVYEAATGKAEDLAMVLEASIPPLASVRTEVPAPIAAVVDRALRREPSQRFEDAGLMRCALQTAIG